MTICQGAALYPAHVDRRFFPLLSLRYTTSSDPVHIPFDSSSFPHIALPLEANMTAVRKEEAMNSQGLILRPKSPFFFSGRFTGYAGGLSSFNAFQN